MATVRKLVRAKNVRFEAVWDAGTRPDGTRIQRSKLFATEREAKLHAAQMTDQVGRLGFTGSDDMTCNQWFDRWMEGRRARGEHSPATYHNDDASLKKWRPMIGKVLVSKLSVSAIDDAVTTLLIAGGHNGKPLSAATVKQHRIVLHNCLEAARKKLKVRADNPVKDTDAPAAKGKRKPRPWTADEAKRILEAASDSDLFLGIEAAVNVLAGGGLRLGELLGLRWPDLDEPRSRLSLSATVVQGDKGRPVFQERMKSENAVRIVNIPAEVVELLRRHRAEQAAYALKLGGDYQRLGLIFPAPDGTPMRPSAMTRHLRKLMQSAGVALGKQPAHAWRHLQATKLLKAGMPIAAVSKRLGHSNPVVTMGFYAHAEDEEDIAAAAAMSSILAGMRPKP